MRVISSDFFASFLHACNTFRVARPHLFNSALNELGGVSWPDEILTNFHDKIPSLDYILVTNLMH